MSWVEAHATKNASECSKHVDLQDGHFTGFNLKIMDKMSIRLHVYTHDHGSISDPLCFVLFYSSSRLAYGQANLSLRR